MQRQTNLSVLSVAVAKKLSKQTGLELATCSSCGKIIIVEENGQRKCPSCASDQH